MTALSSYIDHAGQAVRLRWQRMEILASNIANAATPGFKARDMDFARTYQARLSQGADTPVALLYRQPLMASLDGNTVEMAVEQAEFADNAVHYRASLTFLEQRTQNMLRALKGE